MAATIGGHESSRTGHVGIAGENSGTRGYWKHLLSRDHIGIWKSDNSRKFESR